MSKLIIAGSRTFNDYDLLKTNVTNIDTITEIVSGTAKGADLLGERFAVENNIPIKKFSPNSAGEIIARYKVNFCDWFLSIFRFLSKLLELNYAESKD